VVDFVVVQCVVVQCAVLQCFVLKFVAVLCVVHCVVLMSLFYGLLLIIAFFKM